MSAEIQQHHSEGEVSSAFVPGSGSGPRTDENKSEMEKLQTECERLRQVVKKLEEECAVYRRAFYSWALEQITDEDVQRYAAEEEGLPLEDFIGELEQLAKGNKDA